MPIPESFADLKAKAEAVSDNNRSISDRLVARDRLRAAATPTILLALIGALEEAQTDVDRLKKLMAGLSYDPSANNDKPLEPSAVIAALVAENERLREERIRVLAQARREISEDMQSLHARIAELEQRS